MKHLVMDAADSWPTWAAFLGAAWGGLILVAAVIVRRAVRALAPTPSLDAEVGHAADELGYAQVRDMLDGRQP